MDCWNREHEEEGKKGKTAEGLWLCGKKDKQVSLTRGGGRSPLVLLTHAVKSAKVMLDVELGFARTWPPEDP